MEFTPEQRILFTKKKFIQAAENMKRIYEQAKALEKDTSGLPSFRASLPYVDKLMESAVNHYDTLLELSVLDAGKDLPSENDQANYATLQRYFYKIKEAAISHQPPPATIPHCSTAFNSSVLNTTTSSSRIRLPKITLPEFSGKFLDWPFFRDTYLSLIHQDTSLSNIEKFHYLSSRLKGPALDALKGIAIAENNYEQAWKTLTRIYDSKRRIASSYVQKLISFPPLKGKPTLASLTGFLNNVAESVASFRTLAIPNPGDFILFELAIRGLDPETRQAFELAHTTTDFPTFSDLETFVQQRCAALSMIMDPPDPPTTQPSTNSSIAKSPKSRSVSLFINHCEETENPLSDNRDAEQDTSSRFVLSCPFCSQAHRPKDCEAFNKLSPEKRSDAVKSWKGCLNCLRPGHHIQQCRSPFCCQVCRRRHHTLLHHSPSNSPTKDSIPNKTSSSIPSADNDSQPSGSALTGMATHTAQVLLGTARALIQDASGKFRNIRLVIDSGSQFSFITKSCVTRLGLPTRPFCQAIMGIGQSTLKDAVGRTACQLSSSNDSTVRLSTNAIVVSTIAPLLPQSEIPEHVRDSVVNSTLELADPNFWCPGEVDFLLGADLFGAILRSPRSCQPIVQQPYTLSTIFGAVIMGPLPDAKKDEPRGESGVTFFVNLESNLNNFQELEKPQLLEEDFCDQRLLRIHRRTSSGRNIVPLPVKSKPVSEPFRRFLLYWLITILLLSLAFVPNFRLISPMSSEPSVFPPLTPGHFLVGGPLPSVTRTRPAGRHPILIAEIASTDATNPTFAFRGAPIIYIHVRPERKGRPTTNLLSLKSLTHPYSPLPPQ